jgi:hypothetical protein
MLAEQLPQAIDIAVQSQVLSDDSLNVAVARQLEFQPGLVSKQLLFAVAQRRGALEVALVEGGLLLEPHLVEYLRSVRKFLRDRLADQRRRPACLLAFG